MGAYFEMFKRDRSRMKDIYRRMNLCPLGSGALAGTTYPLDREYTAELLDFDGPTLNSMDSVSDRDYLIELLSAMSTVMMHLSRFSKEVIIWNTNEYKFVEIDDAYSRAAASCRRRRTRISRNWYGARRARIRSAHVHADHDEGTAPCI